MIECIGNDMKIHVPAFFHRDSFGSPHAQPSLNKLARDPMTETVESA